MLRITPAHAGTTYQSYALRRNAQDHPRSRGDYIMAIGLADITVGSPPLTRGLLLACPLPHLPWRITPAHAGTTQKSVCDDVPEQDHPRSRGDYNGRAITIRQRIGSPPLTRGLLYFYQILLCIPRITPAHAGTTHLYKRRKLQAQDHPRSRGDYTIVFYTMLYMTGSPPLTRGLHL